MKHIFFSGIGGTGIGPLALIAHQAGYIVTGSDKQESQYTNYLKSHGINLYIGQTKAAIEAHHSNNPIDWFVYSSALPLEDPNHPELLAVTELGIKHSKRDIFLAHFLKEKQLKLIAFAGTHGKTTSTAMAVWVARQLGLPVSYSVGAKLPFGDMGHYEVNSRYFLYECDEFDRNFLSFRPHISVLTKVDWDHHEQYPSRQDYITAFQTFCQQSTQVYAHQEELTYLSIADKVNVSVIDSKLCKSITLLGNHNRHNAAGVCMAFNSITKAPVDDLVAIINTYPGSSRRFEKIAENIYSDYAHTPEEITATLQLAKEFKRRIVVAYEPLTNRRQHYMREQYSNVFKDVTKLYWLPSYLAREDPTLPVISPEEFIASLENKHIAQTAQKNEILASQLLAEAHKGAVVVVLAGGGGGSLDEWARQYLTNN